MSKVNQDIIDLAAKIKPGISIEIKDGQAVSTIDDTLFAANIPEALTAETIKAVKHYESTFYPAATLAFGEASQDVLKKNKKIESVAGEFKLNGKDTWAVNYARTESFRNPASPDAAPIVKHGVITAKLTTQDARQKIGQLKAVIEEIGVSALAAFGK